MIRFLNVYYPTRTVLLLLCEAILVGSCFIAATFISLGSGDALLALNYEYGWLKIAAVTALSVMFSYYFDLYEPQIVQTRQEIYTRILLVLGFGCFVVSAAIFYFPPFLITNGHVYAIGYAFLAPALIFWRRAYEWIVSQPLFRERVYVLGGGVYAQSIVEIIRSRRDIGMEVVDWQLRDGSPAERREIWVAKLRALGKTPNSVARVIVAMDAQRGELPAEELLYLRFRGVKVEEAGTLMERLSGKIHLDGLRPTNLLYSEGFRLKKHYQLARQVVSTFVAGLGLLSFLPFFPLVVFLVRISSKGPIFFSQARVGMGGRTFDVYKFRSMFIDAESEGARWATKNDPRVTKVGMFMRKTRIDEIPQLWNVLKGDMGFVGPRPERPEFTAMLAEQLPFYDLRHLIRPGLTGWAQIRYGYGATLEEMKEKLQFDLYYIKHMSLGLDLLIMFETIKTIVRRRGAQ